MTYRLTHRTQTRTTQQVKGTKRHHDSVAAFIEEGIIRRELSDNYCCESWFIRVNTWGLLREGIEWLTEPIPCVMRRQCKY